MRSKPFKQKHIYFLLLIFYLLTFGVNKFHATALENGAVDEGTPGIRSDGNYYGYVRDLDGNKITAKCISN